MRSLLPLLAVTVLLSSAASISTASTDNETTKLTGDNGRGSRYGQSVAISNDVVVVGASEEFDRVASAGAAYIYRKTQGNWQREARLVLANRGRFDRFGWSVAASGDAVVVGSNGSGNQVVGIYQHDGSRWNESITLTSTDENVRGFGEKVAVSGDVAVIAAPYSITDGVSGAGSVFIYRFNGTTWLEEATLSLDVPRQSARFGFGVAIHNDLVVVGAPAPYAPVRQGAAYVYRFNGTSWILEAELVTDDDTFEDHFGSSVAISNDVIVIGSHHDDFSGEDSGSAYVFRFDGTQWSQDTRLNPSDAGSFERFGTDVAISDDIIIVGAPGDDDYGRDAGSAYEFRYNGSTWTQVSKLIASDASEIANLGASVSISGDTAFMGASGDDENGSISGAVYSFNVALDTDGDGLSDADDNCLSDWNPLQENFDDDLLGDACDQDDDNDGLDDDLDPAPYNASVSSPPIPVSPIGDGILQGVDFAWTEVSGATVYTIEVQHNGQVRAYEDMILASVACSAGTCRYVKPDAAVEGNNRWRLRAGTNNGTSQWSPWTEFVVSDGANPIDNEDDVVDANEEPNNATLALPQPASPLGTEYYLGVGFRWPLVSGATHYSIEIQHNGTIRGYASMIEADLLCANEQCIYTKTDAAQPGNNRWRLQASNAAGSTAWTPWAEFTTSESGASAIIPAAPQPGAPSGSLVGTSASYQWPAVVGATRYAIEIQHNGLIRTYYENIDASVACSVGNCQFNKPDAALTGENRWRLRSANAAGFSQWSDWRTFVSE